MNEFSIDASDSSRNMEHSRSVAGFQPSDSVKPGDSTSGSGRSACGFEPSKSADGLKPGRSADGCSSTEAVRHVEVAVDAKEVSEEHNHKPDGSEAVAVIDFATRRSLLRYKCDKCGRECPSKHKLKRHLSTHSDARPYPCKLCGRSFKWSEYLQKHMRQQHPSGKQGKESTNTINTVTFACKLLP